MEEMICFLQHCSGMKIIVSSQYNIVKKQETFPQTLASSSPPNIAGSFLFFVYAKEEVHGAGEEVEPVHLDGIDGVLHEVTWSLLALVHSVLSGASTPFPNLTDGNGCTSHAFNH